MSFSREVVRDGERREKNTEETETDKRKRVRDRETEREE